MPNPRGPRKRLTAQQRRSYAAVVARIGLNLEGARVLLEGLNLQPLPSGCRIALSTVHRRLRWAEVSLGDIACYLQGGSRQKQ
jgi:hypothetical protein